MSELFIAYRYLRARQQKRGFVSVVAGFSFLGITLGVATLIIVMSVMNGFRHNLLTRILDFNSHVVVHSAQNAGIENYQVLKDKIESVSGVIHAVPLVEAQGMLVAGECAAGVIVRGMDAQDVYERSIISESLIAGTLKTFVSGKPVLIVGRQLAQSLGISVGQKVRLLSPQGTPSPFGVVPRYQDFFVVGIFDAGMSQYNKSFAFMPMELAQNFYRMHSRASHVEIFLKNPDHLDVLKITLGQVLSDYPNLRLIDWRQSNASFFEAIIVERNVMFLILTLLILIASFNVVSGLVMLVRDKTSDIGILRTIGASKYFILRVFLLVGATIGIVGTFCGAGLGILFVKNIEHIRRAIETFLDVDVFSAEIYFLSRLPAVLDWSEIMLIVSMSLGFSVFATLYPARKAATLHPVEALKYHG